MKKAYKKLSKHAQNEWTILEGKNVHSGPATKVQVSVKILQNFLYLKIKMFPTESNLCRFSTEWMIWKMLLKFTKKKTCGEVLSSKARSPRSNMSLSWAHAQTCHCHGWFFYQISWYIFLFGTPQDDYLSYNKLCVHVEFYEKQIWFWSSF